MGKRSAAAAARRSLLPTAALLLSVLDPPAALAFGHERWANEVIEHARYQAVPEATGTRPRGRRSAVERLDKFVIEEVEIRPRQRARRNDRTEEYLPTRRSRAARQNGRKVASLGRASAAATPHFMAAEPKPSEAVKPSEAAPPPVAATAPEVASLGSVPNDLPPAAPPKPAAGPINWTASANCLASPLRSVLAEVAALFGAVQVNSTCRSKRHNARVGGASRSYHLTGNAVDFRVTGNIKAISQFLLGKRTVGGFKHYGFGLFHIDTGPRRTWNSGPRRTWASARRNRRG
jgi:hypothetical protein